MKNFFYMCASVACLALALLIGFHLGSNNAEAQSTRTVVAYQVAVEVFENRSSPIVRHYVITASGDCYTRQGATEASVGWQLALTAAGTLPTPATTGSRSLGSRRVAPIEQRPSSSPVAVRLPAITSGMQPRP